MNNFVRGFIVFFILGSVSAQAQQLDPPAISIQEIIGQYSKSSGEKVIMDPRVKAKVRVYGQSTDALSYEEFEAILALHNFGSYKSSGYLVVVPLNIIKQQPIELVQEGETFVSNQTVTDIIMLNKLCPENLVPVLRPLVSPVSHFALLTEPRGIIITASYATTLRIREIIGELESHMEKKQNCK